MAKHKTLFSLLLGDFNAKIETRNCGETAGSRSEVGTGSR